MNKSYPRVLLLASLLLSISFFSCRTHKAIIEQRADTAYHTPYHDRKMEMRAVWWPTVFRAEYAKMPPEQMRDDFVRKLDYLRSIGFNAVIFQVRPESDAWYRSSYEPWSRFLTGVQGRSPYPEWDPMAFMIEECHKRCMEFHAWINPYRAATSVSTRLASGHPYYLHPNWFVRFNNQLLYNPSLQACRDYICDVVRDIVSRYDVDAIHMDDYFYPYPVAGLRFPDDQYFRHDPRGFRDIADWRRDNVNLLMAQLKGTIMAIKPHVRLGVSPFGIYRNYKTDKKGSRTAGLQNYDDLYADVLLWDRMGWVDYIMPQIYWNMGHKVADYTELAYWWRDHVHNARLYIGQDVKRTMDAGQLHSKMVIAEKTSDGYCFWPGDEIFKDYKKIANRLKADFWRTPALNMPYPNSSGAYIAPGGVRNPYVSWSDEGQVLTWEPPLISGNGYGVKYYVVYSFGRDDRVKDCSNPDNIVAITSQPRYRLPLMDGHTKVTYYITFVNRYNCESHKAVAVDAVL